MLDKLSKAAQLMYFITFLGLTPFMLSIKSWASAIISLVLVLLFAPVLNKIVLNQFRITKNTLVINTLFACVGLVAASLLADQKELDKVNNENRAVTSSPAEISETPKPAKATGTPEPKKEPVKEAKSKQHFEHLAQETTSEWVQSDLESKKKVVLGTFGLYVLQTDRFKGYKPPKDKAGYAADEKKLIECVDYMSNSLDKEDKQLPVMQVVHVCAVKDDIITEFE